ncbi:MAG TPA: hypothetical protein VGQ53_08540 [Chitinophagaceae bacterium]|nr:hypothetical protein [Chitinophagaceae bacterium]
MNKRLSYEDELAKQLENLALPDENVAWADMKRRLDEEDDDRFIPFWLNGCFLWTLVGVIILTLGWWIIRPEKWFEKKSSKPAQPTAISQSKQKEQNNSILNERGKGDSSVFFGTTTKQQDESAQNQRNEVANRSGRKRSSITSDGEENTAKKNAPEREGKRKEQFNSIDNLSKNNPGNSDNNSSVLLPHPVAGTDSVAMIAGRNTDTTKNNKEKKKNDSLPPNNLADDKKSNSSKNPGFSFAAGLSLHQQLPVNGQKFVQYNLEGRKGSLADYIPSVHLRMYQRDNWFIQSEFRYGAPQYTKEFVYQQKTDSAINGVITQSTTLKKTYYHQVPLTFNYFVSKNLSVGAGFVWNRFASAISSQDIVKHNNVTGMDSIISKGTILRSRLTDSGNVFVKSWFQAVLEAEYKWKRFSLGAKYSIGLQPYIKFELPGQAPQQEKNRALDIFIRYEFWRSKKK